MRFLFTYSVLLTALSITGCGGGGSSDAPQGNINSSNNPPTLLGNPESSVRVGGEYLFTPAAEDVDNDDLAFTVTELPAWLEFDSETGLLFGTPGNSDVGTVNDIVITVSDGSSEAQLTAFSINVLAPAISEDDIQALGEVVTTEKGFESVGDLMMTFADGSSQTFRDASLELEFDESGDLSNLSGETSVPKGSAPNVNLEGDYRADISLKWGSEVNEDEFYNVHLQDNRQYLVYELGTEVNIVVGNSRGEENKERLTISTPASGKVILIQDPYDSMTYVFGEIPFVGAGGTASSTEGLLPFVPLLSNDEIKPFNGHELRNGSIGVGVKLVDFLNFSGERIEKIPGPLSAIAEINFDDPFESTIEYKVGMNGAMEFAFGVLGFGLFSFDLAEASAMMDVGFDHQSLAIRSIIDPELEWAPPWMTFIADSDLDANFILTGAGTLDMWVTGSYQSTLPEAKVTGTIHADLEDVTLSGEIVGRVVVPLSVTFLENETRGEVGINVDYASEIEASVSGGFERAKQTYQDTLDELNNAIGDYEFEVSLRGLREQIPGIVDAIIPQLQAIPGSLRTSVDTAVVNAIRAKEVCKTILTQKVCVQAKDYVNETSIGDDAGEYARDEAAKRIAPYLAMLTELKFRAQQADAEEFRSFLESALRDAYAKRQMNFSYTYSKSLGSTSRTILGQTVSFSFGKVSRTVNVSRTLFNTEQAAAILAAANNMYRIEETDTYVINTNEVLDSLPTPDTIDDVQQQVESGVKTIPNVESINYVVAGGNYSASVLFSNGEEREVDVNVLDVDLTLEAIADLLAHYVLD